MSCEVSERVKPTEKISSVVYACGVGYVLWGAVDNVARACYR